MEDCEFRNSLIGVWIKTSHERGNVIENIEYRRVRVKKVRDYAVCITMGYYVDGNAEGPRPNMPKVRRVMVDGLTCDQAGTGVKIEGAEGYPVTDVRLSNILCCGDRSLDIRSAEGLCMENVSFPL